MRYEQNRDKIQKRSVVLLDMHVLSVDTYMPRDGQTYSLPYIHQLPRVPVAFGICAACLICQQSDPGRYYHIPSLFANRGVGKKPKGRIRKEERKERA
jgi:hypothetical protein